MKSLTPLPSSRPGARLVGVVLTLGALALLLSVAAGSGVAPVSAGPAAAPAAGTTVRLQPSTIYAGIGDTIPLRVMADGASNLGAGEFSLTYQSAIAQATGAAAGAFLTSTGRQNPPDVDPSLTVPLIATTSSGGITSYGVGLYTIGSSPDGPNGTGEFAFVNLQGIAAGTTALGLQDVQLTDILGNTAPESPVTAQGGTLTVLAEPSRSYLAEGDTGNRSGEPNYDTFILLQNPDPNNDAHVTVVYLEETGNNVAETHTVPANKRYTIAAHAPDQIGKAGRFSSKIISDRPLFVERAQYWNSMSGGHGSTGRSALANTWYLAEGYTGGSFLTFIAIENPGNITATVNTTYMIEGESTVTRAYSAPPNKRITVAVHDDAALAGKAFSTKLESDQPIVVERSMYWNNYTGGTNAPGMTGPANDWYLAEGYTGSNGVFYFDTFILLQNPDMANPAQVTLNYQLSDGTTVSKEVTVNPNSRKTVTVHDPTDPAGLGRDKAFSTWIHSDRPILAERAMYWNNFTGGHNSIPAGAPVNTWYLAEGYTGSNGVFYFDTFILIQNPDTVNDASVQVTYQVEGGTNVIKTYPVPKASRVTIPVHSASELGRDKAFATQLVSTRPIVVERAMYWNDFREGHNTVGITTP